MVIWMMLLLLLFSLAFPESKKLLFILCGVYFLLAALRSSTVGNDTQNYLELFNWFKYYGVEMVETLSWRYESGFLYYVFFVTKITSNEQGLLIISALFTYFVFFIIIKKYSMYPMYSMVLLIFLGFFDQPMNVLRFSISAALTMIALDNLVNNRKMRFYIFVLFATLFHRSAIVFLVSRLLWNKKLNFKKMLPWLLVTIVFMLFFNKIFIILLNVFPVYSYYIGSGYLSGNIKLASLIMLLLNTIIYFMTYYELKNNRSNMKYISGNNQYINYTQFFLNLGFVGILIMIVSFKFNLLSRVSDLFTIYLPLAYSNSLFLNKNKEKKLLFMVVIAFILFCYYVIVLVYRPEWNKVYPYNFFWD